MGEITLDNVTKRFGQSLAVDGVSLHVKDHEFLVIVGPSGCGKSTTLRMIAGLEQPDSGRVHIGSRDVTRVAPKDRDVAMVFQNYALYPHMNVYQNMSFGLRMRKTPKAEIDRRVREAAATLGITPLLQRKPGQLSGGERQRVAVGRAIVRDPAVFLFDEPLSNLDAKLRVTMRSELVRLQERLKTTMVYVTHDQVEAMMMGHRVVVMHAGRVQQVGSPQDVYHRPANRFVAEFIGSPPMNLWDVHIHAGSEGIRLRFDSAERQFTLPDLEFERLAAWNDQLVTMGIRPEDVDVSTDEGLPSLWQLPGIVTAAHALGAETLLEVNLVERDVNVERQPARTWTVRVGSRTAIQRQDRVTLMLDPRKAHFFERETGERL